MKAVSIKAQLIIFLSAFAIFLSIKNTEPFFLLTTLAAVISAALADSTFVYFKQKKFLFSSSAVISGLIIGFVLSSELPLWIFLLASILAVSSKHFVRLRQKHIFNPAAFGVFSSIFFLGAETQWHGTYLWQVLIPVGLYFSYKINKLPLLVAYGLTAVGLFAIQAALQKAPMINIFGYLSYFYIFIMVVEPKTTPVKFPGKILFGIGVAVLIFILTEAGVEFDAELCALLILNLFTPFLNKILQERAL